MPQKVRTTFFVFVATFILGACSLVQDRAPATDVVADPTMAPTESSMGEMGDMGMDGSMSSQDFAPLVGGIYEDGEVFFIHTESSDPGVAALLTDMMDGVLVVLVPELADTPAVLLAKVFVFTNGIDGFGPFGFQQDIFDSVPGDAEYRPLRAVNLVEWIPDIEPYELRTIADLFTAETNGEVSITSSGIVVNMPIMSWPDGHR